MKKIIAEYCKILKWGQSIAQAIQESKRIAMKSSSNLLQGEIERRQRERVNRLIKAGFDGWRPLPDIVLTESRCHGLTVERRGLRLLKRKFNCFGPVGTERLTGDSGGRWSSVRGEESASEPLIRWIN